MSAVEQIRDAAPSILGGYFPAKGVFDEAVSASGEIRPHWRTFAEEFAKLSSEDHARRLEIARQVIRANGVMYNLYDVPNEDGREWQLDPIPLIISSQEWAQLERSLIQRAHLLNLILADCYGPQKMMKQGILPPALIFGHPSFLRVCHGLPVPSSDCLTFYSVDVARSPDGRWWVVSDRSQAPSGAGYALENRAAISRMMPDIYQKCGVRSLGDFPDAMRDALARLAPRNKDNPCVALLTPGPFNEIYFEHTYLARQMGFLLAQGEDLTVRDNQVFLKTVKGLRVVDVIMRRVDDDFCDPLELRSDSFLGIPGLVNVVRSGNVAVANMLGSGVIQNPALMPFLPGLCKHLLGEELLMPCVATWWCGQKPAFEEVFEKLDHLVVRSTSDLGVTVTGLPVGTYGAKEREDLWRRVSSQPHSYIGQEQVVLSTSPVLNHGIIESRATMLRIHLVARDGSYVVMPGGLTRIASSSDTTSVSMQRGAASKDTWVLSPTSTSGTVAITPSPASFMRKQGDNLPSRLADNLFWMGRYMERLEAHTRLIRTLLSRLTEEFAPTTEDDLKPFFSYLRRYAPLEGSNISEADSDAYLVAVIFGTQIEGGLKSSINQVSKIMRVVRESFSPEANRMVVDMNQCLKMPQMKNRAQLGEALVELEFLLTLLLGFSGMQYESMGRNFGWRFFDMGRRVERGIFCLELAMNLLWSESRRNPFTLEAALEMNDNLMSYRTRYFSAPHLAAVMEVLIKDKDHPRSGIFQLSALGEHFKNLSEGISSQREDEVGNAVCAMTHALEGFKTELLMSEENYEAVWGAQRLVQDQLVAMYRLSDTITVNYFSHSQVTYRSDQLFSKG